MASIKARGANEDYKYGGLVVSSLDVLVRVNQHAFLHRAVVAMGSVSGNPVREESALGATGKLD